MIRWPCDAIQLADALTEILASFTADIKALQTALAADEADAKAESGVIGADRLWDEAMSELCAALASQSTSIEEDSDDPDA